MHRWATLTRAAAGAALLAIAGAGAAQDAAIPRAEGYAELDGLPDIEPSTVEPHERLAA